MPHIEIHARRFADDEEERKQVFNSQPVSVNLDPDDELIIRVRGGIVEPKINGIDQMPIVLGQWEYTAFAIVCDPQPEE